MLTSVSFASNQAIVLRVETKGQHSKDAKIIIEDLCISQGYTVVDRDNQSLSYYEQDLKNNDRYNGGTAPNTGNMIIASHVLIVESKVIQDYYFNGFGSVGGAHGGGSNRHYSATLNYQLISVELGTKSEVHQIKGSANDTDLRGTYAWIFGRYGENSNAVQIAAIHDAAQNMLPKISSIAMDIMNNYYNQTEGSYQPYPNPQSPATYYPDNNSNTNDNTSYNSTSPNNQTQSDPFKVNFSEIDDKVLTPQHYVILDSNTNYLLRVFTSNCSAYEVLKIKDNFIIYKNGTSVAIDSSSQTKLELYSLGSPGEKIKFALSNERIRYFFEVQY